MQDVRVDRWSPALGAEVLDIDLGALVRRDDDDRIGLVYDALIEHQVLFFRNQGLPPDAHRELGVRLGELAPRHHSYATLDGHPDVAVLDWLPGIRPDASEWHSDMTFRAKPPFASILKAIVVPPVGGDTLWASMYSVHDALDPGFRADLETLLVDHDPGQFRNGAYEAGGNAGIAEMHARAGGAVWPIISHHPVTGRPYINVSESNSRWIIGLGAAESQRILSYLFDMINRPEHHVRLRWQPDTVAIWDNRATQHYAVADYTQYRRTMHRVAVDTDRRLEQSIAAHAVRH
ncbi:MAG: taurine dioxygenase [Ilumatobacter sp.]|nr:taurine dioxygenase [Ilumatobacter sp.]